MNHHQCRACERRASMTPEQRAAYAKARARCSLFLLLWCLLWPVGLVYGWGWEPLGYMTAVFVALLAAVVLC